MKKGNDLAISDFLDKKLNSEEVDVLTFAESPAFLGIDLFPIQRFILKLIYNIPLSDITDRPIILKDRTGEKIIATFTHEQDFMDFLYERGMISTNDPSKLGNVFEVFLAIGRRGTKTVLISIVGVYELYKLLRKDNVHRYLRIIEKS